MAERGTGECGNDSVGLSRYGVGGAMEIEEPGVWSEAAGAVTTRAARVVAGRGGAWRTSVGMQTMAGRGIGADGCLDPWSGGRGLGCDTMHSHTMGRRTPKDFDAPEWAPTTVGAEREREW